MSNMNNVSCTDQNIPARLNCADKVLTHRQTEVTETIPQSLVPVAVKQAF